MTVKCQDISSKKQVDRVGNKKSKKMSLAVGRGETLNQITNTNNSSNIVQGITNEELTSWKYVIISSSLPGLFCGALYRFSNKDKNVTIITIIIYLSIIFLMVSISPFFRKIIGFLLFMSHASYYKALFVAKVDNGVHNSTKFIKDLEG